jgi:hypothetical protein
VLKSIKYLKVWSDLKYNARKRGAKANREAKRTGGGPALTSSPLTTENERVLSIIGSKAVTGLPQGIEAGYITVCIHLIPL